MSELSNKSRYLENARRFVAREIEGEEFCHIHCYMREADRDEQAALRQKWPERYDLQLISALQAGEFSKEEFRTKWENLWGYADYQPLVEMTGRLFTACDIFVPDTEEMDYPEYQYTEEQLRDYVAQVLAEYAAEETPPSPTH